MQRAKITNVLQDGSIDYDRVEAFKLPTADYPLFYYAFILRPPGILTGYTPKANEFEGFCLVSKEEVKKYTPNGGGFRLGPMHIYSFVAMVAKIAHGFAVAELGLDSFSPFLTTYIRGFPDSVFQYVGGAAAIPPKTNSLHEIRLSRESVNGRHYAMVTLRLFSLIGAPEYRIIVGELSAEMSQSLLLQKPLHTIDVKPPIPAWDLVPAESAAAAPGPR